MRPRGVVLPLTCCVAAIAACNPFGTGTPDPPDGGVINYPTPTTPENVLEIIALSLNARDNRAYMDRLASDFSFSPDPVQRQSDAFENFPATWDRVREEAFLGGLFTNSDSIGVVWSYALTQPQGNRATVTAHYTVTIRRQTATEYRGRADFLMEETGGVWNIRTWEDVVVEGETHTWGLLRAQL